MKIQKPDLSIMLIERDEVSLHLLELLFKKAGYNGQLMTSTSLTEAAAFVTTHSPDLVITDFFLNKLDDFRFVLLARQLEALLKKPIHIVILGDFENDKHRLPEGLKTDFALKPVSMDIVERWLKTLQII
jgi:CheY-like chemotaxis protein